MKRGVLLIGIFICLFLLNLVVAEKLISDAGVEYDASIVERFENKTWVHVSIAIKDTSGIVIEGTKEERIELIRQKNKFISSITDDVFTTLSESEFSIIGQKLDVGFEVTAIIMSGHEPRTKSYLKSILPLLFSKALQSENCVI